MSDNVQLNYDAATANLLDKVFAPVFFQKLASYGIQPSNQDEAMKLIQLAQKIEYLDGIEAQKQAQARGSWVDYANQVLDQAIGTTPNYNDPTITKLATDFAADQNLRDSALLYNDALLQAANAN